MLIKINDKGVGILDFNFDHLFASGVVRSAQELSSRLRSVRRSGRLSRRESPSVRGRRSG